MSEKTQHGWTFDKLGNYVKLQGGNAFKSRDFKDNGIPLLRIANIRNNGIELDGIAYIDDEIAKTYSSYLLKESNVVIAMSGATTGKTGIIKKENLPLLLNQRVGVFKIKKDNFMIQDYLRFVVQSSYFQNVIKIDAIGGAQPNISPKQIESIHVYIPPLDEQQKIAAILSSVDKAIDKTKEIIEETETVKKGLMQQLLINGIRSHNFKVSPIGSIPEAWQVLSFNKVFDRIRTKNYNNNQNVLTISGEKGLVNQLDYFNKSVSSKNLSNYIYLEKGDFAYNKSYSNGYPLGAIKMLDKYDNGVVSTLYICFRLKQPYLQSFYKHYFDSGLWNRQVYNIAPEGGRSHGLLNVGVKDFFEILIPVPSIEEQQEISDRINAIEYKKEIEQKKLSKLTNIKQGLMQQLLTGKVRVPINEDEEVPS
ncbi:type I restriction enzyme S subunit [Alkalibacillus salilacus]|uniref:Type I restriction enzyme S subunit n=2 Tax=Alkalibacillus salilacus TaxID=284582 RepID=A0ABT9VGD3_9BACI|nr:type I restriction enzyme S subunit [Alkalibacillus salilacus]